ncbi:MAG: RNA polymerase sigma factor [Spirosomaceae bacterium]|jgi:RNA polymerase sigma-70 factor (ECF subfamily)|nr:RNA polymerase sigma factor [Spirosomataceae bacterium]
MYKERELVEACIRQERNAQRQLYELYASKLLVTAMRYMKNRDDAEDVLQDSFIKIFKHLDSFRFDCPLDAWLRRIVVNTALKQLKKQAEFMQQIDSQLVADEVEQSELTISGFQFEQLMAMVASLPDGCRTVFNLYAIEGYQHNEIAELLGISEGTSKSQYSRAKSLLQAKILKEKLPLIK